MPNFTNQQKILFIGSLFVTFPSTIALSCKLIAQKKSKPRPLLIKFLESPIIHQLALLGGLLLPFSYYWTRFIGYGVILGIMGGCATFEQQSMSALRMLLWGSRALIPLGTFISLAIEQEHQSEDISLSLEKKLSNQLLMAKSKQIDRLPDDSKGQ